MKRLPSIDRIRGLVMVIMALDHVRDLFHIPALMQDPTDLATTTPAIFLTRWITHLCAPTFVFLSGTSAYLMLRNYPPAEGRRFLLTRGIALLLLELTVINFAFWFDVQFRTIMLQVIYAIGGGLLLLSVLSRLPVRWIGFLGLLIVFGHNLLPAALPSASPAVGLVWSLLFRSNLFSFGPSFSLLVAYPLIPWLGIMLAGFAAGRWMERPPAVRKRWLWRIGLAALTLFIVLRFLNQYGDPAPWAVQNEPVMTALSFLNVTKYPPSLLYALVTCGLMLLGLALADGVENAFTRWLAVYGKVPMFYYLIHWYLIHLGMYAMSFLQGYSWADIPSGPLNFGRPPGAGISLGGVYVVWTVLVLLLYPLCRWYGRYKAAHPEKVWLRYI